MDKKTARIELQLSSDLKQKFVSHCKKNEISVSQKIKELIKEAIKK